MNNKKRIKESFSKINVSKSLENKVFDITINKKNNCNCKFRFVYVTSIILFGCFLSLSIVYAKEIKNFIKNWSSHIAFFDGTKTEISQNNEPKELDSIKLEPTNRDSGMKIININELDQSIGFHILNSDESTLDEIGYFTYLNDDGSIGRVNLWYPSFIQYSDERIISMSASFLTENADESYVIAFEDGINVMGNSKIITKYQSENLNTDIIVCNDGDNRISTYFVYDDVIYKLIAYYFDANEIVEIVENLY